MDAHLAAWLLSALAAAPATFAVPSVTVCGERQAPVLDARIEVAVEVFGPDDGAPANPVARFPNVRVAYAIEATTLDVDRQGEDGGVEPSLELFEPLRPDGRYWLPWDIPNGTKLVEDDRWGGWNAWLGNDNDGMGDNTLEFVDVTKRRVDVRWNGRIDTDCPFVLEGALRIGEVRVTAPGDADVAAVLATVFGDLETLGARVTIERSVDSWTKTPRITALVTPR